MLEVIPAEVITTSAEVMLAEAAADPFVAKQLDGINGYRWACAEDVRALRAISPYLPQLPDTEVHEVYERVIAAEARVVGRRRLLGDYDLGRALVDDDLLVVSHAGGTALLEAQHATNPVRKASGRREAADHGTGGLGLVIAEDVGGSIVVPRGRQTGNANVDQDHPVKEQLLRLAATGNHDHFFSVHGMQPGKVLDLRDPTEVHAVVGLGLEPTEADWERAQQLATRAWTDLGLNVVVGNEMPHLNFAKDPDWDGLAFRDLGNQLARTATGELAAPRVAGLMPTSTVTVMRQQTGLPSRQLEISRSLRLMPVDAYRRRDVNAEAYAVYLGYQLCRLALQTR